LRGRTFYAAWTLLAVVVITAACAPTQAYMIKDLMPPKRNIPGRIRKVAVVGFKAKENLGDVVIGKIAHKIQRSGRYTVFERDALKHILAEKNLAEADLAEVGSVQNLKLGAVDALVTGEIRTTWRQVDYWENKITGMIEGPYGIPIPKIEKVKTLADVGEITLNIKMVDLGGKAKVLAQHSFTKGFHSKKDKKLIQRLRDEKRQKGFTPMGVYELLIDDCVTEFVQLIIPYYVKVPVKLLKGGQLNDVGIKFMIGDNFEDAEESFKNAMSAEPEKIEPVYNLALCYEACDKLEPALEYYRKTLMLRPAHTPSIMGINRVRKKIKKEAAMKAKKALVEE